MNYFQKKRLAVLIAAMLSPAAYADGHIMNIGEVTGVIAEASTADSASEMMDGMSGDTSYPFVRNLKAIATVGEVDRDTGMALTGYPDGQAAWLADEETVRVVYQSESYATMSSETYGWQMSSGVEFTGSHIHTIDYDRAGLADFLGNDSSAADIVEGSDHLFNRVYNVFGDEVIPKSQGGIWGNQVRPDGTIVEFIDDFKLSNGDFFFQSFCGAFYEPANKYGDGIGFADPVWLTGEEWNIGRMFGETWDTNDGMGLASIVVDIANETAYTAPALGQSGYEKLMPINPLDPDYTVIVLSGYNHGVEPAPLKIYVGMKGMDSNGQPLASDANDRDQFLARNGLLYGKIYGLAVANDTYASLGITDIDPTTNLMDDYVLNANAADTFTAALVPTSYEWGGWDSPVAVKDTEIFLWQEASEQPAGHTYFNGDTKTEHGAVDPDITKQRWVQNLTQEGALLSIELTDFLSQIAGGGLPSMLSAKVTRVVGAADGTLTLEVGKKGIKHGGIGTHATWEDERAKTVAPDGLAWIKSSDGDVLIVDEDSGNDYGERKFALSIDPETMMLTENATGYFLAAAGGSENPRAAAEVAVYPGAFSSATSSEFSGTWNLTAMLAKKDDGSFYSMQEIAGTGEQEINGSIPLADHTLLGVVQHRGESGGPVAEVEADNGGQVFVFNMKLPQQALAGSNCDYSNADRNDGWGWDPVAGKSCSPMMDDGACDYSAADVNNGWGWNPVTGTSCPPKDEPPVDNCDYSAADSNNGWGWDPVAGVSCKPR